MEVAEGAAFAGKVLVSEFVPQRVRIAQWLQETSPSMDPFLKAASEEARHAIDGIHAGTPIGL